MSEIKTLPVLPLRDIVVFPHMVVPLFVGRDKSVRALEEVMNGDKQILLVTQKNSADDDPAPAALIDRILDGLPDHIDAAKLQRGKKEEKQQWSADRKLGHDRASARQRPPALSLVRSWSHDVNPRQRGSILLAPQNAFSDCHSHCKLARRASDGRREVSLARASG